MRQIVEKSNVLISLVLFALLARMISLPNFSPLDAIALFCGAYCTRYFTALTLALLTVWLSDLFINKIVFDHWVFFYSGFYWQYSCYGLIVLLGTRLSVHTKAVPLAFASLSASILFFLISNFGVWYSGVLYPHTLDGLLMCFAAAIPFFKNTLLSDLLFIYGMGCLVWCKTAKSRLFLTS